MYYSLWLVFCLGTFSNILLASQYCNFPSYSPNLKYSQAGVKQIKRVEIPQNHNISDQTTINLSAAITFSESLINSQLSYAAVLRNLYDINPQNGLAIQIRVSSISRSSLNFEISASQYNDITLLAISYLLVVKDESLQQKILILQNVRKFQPILQISKTKQTIWLTSLNSPISTKSNAVSWLSGISIQMKDSTIQLRTSAIIVDSNTVQFALTTYQAQNSFVKEVSYTIIIYNPSQLKQTKIKFLIESGFLQFSRTSSEKIQLQAYQFNTFLGISSFAFKASDFPYFGFEIVNKTSNLKFYYTSYYNQVPYLIIKSYYCPFQYQFYYALANSCLRNCPLPAINNIVDLECDGKVSVDNSSCEVEDTWVKTFVIAFSISFVICFAIGAYFIYKRCKKCNENVQASSQEDKDKSGKQLPIDYLDDPENINKNQEKKEGNSEKYGDYERMSGSVQIKKATSFQSEKLQPFKFPDNINPQIIQSPNSEGCDSMQNIPS